MNPMKRLSEFDSAVRAGTVDNLEPLLPLFTIDGHELSLVDREPLIPIFKLNRPKRTTLLSGRQISKSYTIAELVILLTGFGAGFRSVVVEPRHIQKKNFNAQILTPLLRDCAVRDLLIEKRYVEPLDRKIFKSGGEISLLQGILSPDQARGSSGASLVALDELQDIPNSFIPVFEAVADAKVNTGFRIRSGTAKTSDGALALSFGDSSQGHWCIKCPCGKYNIAALEEQLLKMIGKEGCSCAYCQRKLDVLTGYYVHKYPSRLYTHAGYHMPQIIFPFHNTKPGWTELLYKKATQPKTQFLNEVLGAPDDESVRLLTKEELLKARNNVHTKREALSIINHYNLRILGVDWGGGGGGDSATGIAVIGKNFNANSYQCIYMNRLQQGLTPEQEADIVRRAAQEFEVDYIAHDFTGAGFVRETLFTYKYPEWRDHMFPITYSYKPTSDLVTFNQSGSRASYTVDKTKSLLLTINAIKYNALSIPWFDIKDLEAPQLDFLSIIEHQQRLEESEAGGKNTVQRASEVYLLDKVAGRKDDAAQAVNVAFIALCHVTGDYPVFTFDDKYTLTQEQYELLVGDEEYVLK